MPVEISFGKIYQLMYKLLIVAVLISSTASAQLKEGKVIYERKMNMHKDMPPEAEQFKAMVPEFTTAKMELIFNGSQSLYHPQPGAEEDQMPEPGGDGRRINIRMGGMDGESFRDYDKEQLVESRELGPKTYIIEDSLKAPKWKLEDDTLRILGYLCHKATTMQPNRMRRPSFAPAGDSTQAPPPPPPDMPVTVWYTEEIESQAGPDNLFGLPGIILGANINNGTIVYKALSIEPAPTGLVKAPTNGKKITREEYRKMMQEQMRNMGGRGGPGGPVIRIVQ
jgi:GLPGLI family protein